MSTRTKLLCTKVLCMIVAALLSAACGGRSRGGQFALDGGLDGGGLEGPFCEGVSKVGVGEDRYGPVTVTSTAIVMDCCEGAWLRFHSAAHLGFDVSVEIQAMLGWVAGDYDLGAAPGGLGVRVHQAGVFDGPEQTLEGWLRVDFAGQPYEDPLVLSMCATVTSANDPLDGYQLYAADVPIMAWSWYERFSIVLLEDPLLYTPDVVDIPLDALTLDDSPVVVLANLEYYSQSTHTLHWESWVTDSLRANLPAVPVYGLPFVVMADDEPIYLGSFVTSLSSESFDHPVIVLEDMTDSSATIASGYPAGSPSNPDPRADPRILEVLSEAGKLTP